jgi:hypothetical protein
MSPCLLFFLLVNSAVLLGRHLKILVQEPYRYSSPNHAISTAKHQAKKDMMRQHREAGLSLTAPGGLLTQLAKPVPETARRSYGRQAA